MQCKAGMQFGAENAPVSGRRHHGSTRPPETSAVLRSAPGLPAVNALPMYLPHERGPYAWAILRPKGYRLQDVDRVNVLYRDYMKHSAFQPHLDGSSPVRDHRRVRCDSPRQAHPPKKCQVRQVQLSRPAWTRLEPSTIGIGAVSREIGSTAAPPNRIIKRSWRRVGVIGRLEP